MTQTYNTQVNKAPRKNEKNSKKEILDRKKPENRIKPGYYRTTPSYICDDPKVKSYHRDVFGLIAALCSRHGHCDYYNWEFAEYMRIGKTTFQRYLNHLQKLGYVVIEIESQFIRKIWTCETWANRERISKIYPLPQIRDTPSQIRDDSNIDTHNLLLKEVVKKSPAEGSQAPPPSAITTSVPQKNKKPQEHRPQKRATETEIAILEDKFGKKIVAEKIKKSTELAKDPKAFTKKSEYDYIYEWSTVDSKKKAKTFLKKGDQMEFREQEAANAYQKEEAHAKKVEKYLNRLIELNPNLKNDIIINTTQHTVELRDKINQKRFNTYKYTDPVFKSRMDSWIEDHE